MPCDHMLKIIYSIYIPDRVSYQSRTSAVYADYRYTAYLQFLCLRAQLYIAPSLPRYIIAIARRHIHQRVI